MRTSALRSPVDHDRTDGYSPSDMASEKDTRDIIMKVRVSKAEQEFFADAAGRRGLDVSSWARSVCRMAAEEILGKLAPGGLPVKPTAAKASRRKSND